ncbi:LCP family protein [Brevibacillus sp. TJ4]|uniref:LCP family protein n=1 Tax=Brevibacillus sp. TJ4 TaxID=3234853 RepID=UPI0037CD5094
MSFQRITLRLLVTGVIFCLVVIGYTVYEYKQLAQQWYVPIDGQTVDTADGAGSTAKADQPQREVLAGKVPLDPFVLLILGVDSRDGEAARSDTMLLAAVNPGKQSAYLISIPRDSYLDIPGKGYDKVNHAMAFGGPKLVKQSLESFLGIRIDRYVTVDFEGFRQIVDQLGGVTVDVQKRMKYSDPTDDTYIDLSPGVQKLSGEQALDYARYRMSDLGAEDSDYERIARQQEIIRALATEAASSKALTNLYPLLEIVGQHVKTDLTEGEIASLLLSFGTSGTNQVQTDTLRGRDERIWHNGVLGWYHLVTKDERQRVRKQLEQALIP